MYTIQRTILKIHSQQKSETLEQFKRCGNNVGNPERTRKILYCRFIRDKIVQFGCNTY